MSTDPASIPRVFELPANGSLSHWVMVGQVPEEIEDAWSYRTGAVKTVRAVRAATGEVDALIDESWSAWPLLKRAGQAFSGTILLGRAPTNDIWVPHSSVSKLHARLRLDGAEVLLSDASSSNGTIVNGDAVWAGDEVLVESGDLVRFGACVFQVFSPVHMTAVLQRLRG